MSVLTAQLTELTQGRDLPEAAVESAFDAILSGEVGEAEIAGLLMGLAVKGETAVELLGAARALRAKAVTLKAPDAVDTCGTGGDGQNTLNISTAAAIVAAAAGAKVAKHGNRAVSSRSGSSDVLSALGIVRDLPPARAQACLDTLGITFLMAPVCHRAVAHVMPVRQALKVRTVFNLLGPLANPAGAGFQLVGVYAERWLAPMAQALQALGTRRAWVVHGSDGLDEITVTGPTMVHMVSPDGIETRTVTPEQAGLTRWPSAELAGGTADDNAAALEALLAGANGAYRDAALINAGAALMVCERAEDLSDGVAQAARAIDSGAAKELLGRWRRFCSEGRQP